MSHISELLIDKISVFYNDEKNVKMFYELEEKFLKNFGDSSFSLFSAPGRTELSGNHTDHNNGKVLAGSISLDTKAIAAKNDGNVIRILSEGFDEMFVINLDELKVDENGFGKTSSLIKGIAFRLKDLGYEVGGFDAYIKSDVLVGSGLSSSASFEVLIAQIFNTFFNNNEISPVIMAQCGQYAENYFFGKPCGLMDQIACAYGGIVAIDFKDPENPVIENIKINFKSNGYSLFVIDTGGNHANLTNDYSAITDEMKLVANFFGKNYLNEISSDEFYQNIPELMKSTGHRSVLRAMHFFEENNRVEKQKNALLQKDVEAYLNLVNLSGNSSANLLQNIYSVNSPQDQEISIALALVNSFIEKAGSGACRVHGGGFAGTIQAYIKSELKDEFLSYCKRFFKNEQIIELKIRSSGAVCLD